jgi:PAS domain S-box-containing protein
MSEFHSSLPPKALGTFSPPQAEGRLTRERPDGVGEAAVVPAGMDSGAELLTASLGSFSESLDALRATCTILERKCTNLNWALDKANRRLKTSLAEREQIASRLDSILRCLSVGVMAVNLEGRLIEFNEAAESITGHAKRDVLGTLYHEIVGRGLADDMGPLRTMEDGVGVEHREKTLTTAEGDRIPVGFSTSLVKGEGGEILGAVEVFDDLRTARLMEEELLRTRTLAAVGEMAAEVARQVRNPLAGLAGFTELLARDLASDPRRDPLIGKIREGVVAVESAVTRLLETARPMSARFRSANVASILGKVLDLFEGSVGPAGGIRLRRRLECPEARARVDEEQVRQAFWNLLTNARDAMPDGGDITVVLDQAEGASFVVIAVTDSGEGMTPETAENAFEPFFTTREGRAGMGLTAVRRIVTGHGGDVRLESGPGSGTRVILRIPSEPAPRTHSRWKGERCRV